MKREQEKQGITVLLEIEVKPNTRKRKAKTGSCEGLGMICKIAKLSTNIRDRDILSIGSLFTNKAFQKKTEQL